MIVVYGEDAPSNTVSLLKTSNKRTRSQVLGCWVSSRQKKPSRWAPVGTSIRTTWQSRPT